MPSLVQASVPSNTFVVGGNAEVKQVTDLLPDIYYQLGQEGIARLMKLAESMGMNPDSTAAAAAEDDDEVPELVENFEEAANK
jgi:nascent polypeptide-associated complex subunit beta